MIDLHCHLLPGIDDGAKSLDQALDIARASVNNGIRHAIVTPHLDVGRYENTRSTIGHHLVEFRQALQHADIALEIGMAAEVRIAPEILTLLDQLGTAFGITLLTLAYGGEKTEEGLAFAFSVGAGLAALSLFSASFMSRDDV